YSPSHEVKRSTASNSNPARRKRMPPVQMGGHAATSHLVPALLPPQRKATNSRLPAMATLCFGCGTRRVSQCACPLPMKFVKVGRDSRRAAVNQLPTHREL